MSWVLQKDGEAVETLSEDNRDFLLARGWVVVEVTTRHDLLTGAQLNAEPPADMGALLDDLAADEIEPVKGKPKGG